METQERNFKRVLLMGDLHSGHRVGLTPPWVEPYKPEYDRWSMLRRELWNHYESTVLSLKPIDYCMINADCIDGRGERSGGHELILPNRQDQCKCASSAIKIVNAGSYHMTYGTPYHTGKLEDWECGIAKELDATIGGHEWYTINGVTIDMKHKVGNTQVPYSKGTAISRERLWNMMWQDIGEQPKAQIIVRSHVHWHFDCGDHTWRGIYLPALQGQGTKFGARQCSNIVHFGVVHLDIYNDGRFRWEPHIVQVEQQVRKSLVLS